MNNDGMGSFVPCFPLIELDDFPSQPNLHLWWILQPRLKVLRVKHLIDGYLNSLNVSIVGKLYCDNPLIPHEIP